jgi:tetratricopeptide (TPR) repeat protein
VFPKPTARKKLILAGCLVLVTLAAYWHIRGLAFLSYDDTAYVTENTHLRSGLTWRTLVWAFTSMQAANWHPLTWLSHVIDFELYGMNPTGHHLTNLIVHLLNVVLLFWVLQTATAAIWRSAFAAALFAVHPMNVESVAWVAERKNVLSTLFFILTIWAYVWYVRKPGWQRYLVVTFSFILGLMSKPMLVTLPFLLLLLDYWPLSRYEACRGAMERAGDDGGEETGISRSFSYRRLEQLVLEKVPLLALVVASCVVTYAAQNRAGAVGSAAEFPFSLRLANALVSYSEYLEKMFWPTGLAIVYPFKTGTLPTSHIAVAAIILLMVSGAVLWTARRSKYSIVGWLWYLGTLVPVIGLVQVGSQARADRYAYIPLIGVFIILVWGASDAANAVSGRARLLLPLIGLLIVMAAALATRHQITYWRDSETLFDRAQSVTDNNYIAYNMLGSVLALQGRFDESIAELSRIPPSNSLYDKAQNALGMVLVQKGLPEDAVTHFKMALEANPSSADACNRLGAVLLDEGKPQEAISFFRKTLEISPSYVSAYANLGAAFEGADDPAQAVTYYNTALQLTMRDIASNDNDGARMMAAQLNLRVGNLYARSGKTTEAADRYLEALRFEPSYEPAKQAMSRLPDTGQNRIPR